MEKKVRRRRQIMRNRTIILRSARDLFHKKGFYATTMEDIAQYSGFDRRTIYNHFKNKDEIFSALISIVIADMAAIYDNIIAENIPTIEKLRKLVPAVLDLYIENSQLLSIFMSEYETSGTKKKKQLSTYMLKNIFEYKEIENRVMEQIKKAQEEGSLIKAHPYILAGVLNELILRSVIVLHNNKKDITKEEVIGDILRLLEGNIFNPQAA